MIEVIRGWLRRYLSDSQVIVCCHYSLGFGVALFMGGMLAPVLAALVIAYLLEGLIRIGARVDVSGVFVTTGRLV